MHYLFLDYETYYNTADGYTLSRNKMSMSEYIRDPRFKSFGAALAFGQERAKWLNHEQLVEEFKTIDFSQVAVVSQNAKFDHAILVWKYGVHPAMFLDTLSMARAVIGTKIRKFSLASLAEYYGLEPKGSLHTDGLLTLSPDQERELGEYCEHDTDLCRDIFYKMLPEFPESQFFQMDWTIRAFVYPKLRLDTKLLSETAVKERKRRETIFQEIGIDKKIFSSNEKFAELLRKEGYEVPTKKSPSTGEDIPAFALGDEAFQEMVNSDDDRLADLCEARIAAKSNLLETRSEKLRRVGAYGPFPVDIQFSGALQTHRASGGNGSGGNFQNFTKGSALRQSVTVEEGHRLIVADLANIEFRIVSYLANDPILVGMIENGTDIYCDFASKIYQRPIVKGDKERQFGKTAILGLGYGMGWDKFKRTVKKDCRMDITDEFAKETVYFYRGYYKGVPALWEKLDYVLDHMVQGGRGQIFNSPRLTYQKHEIILPSGLRLRYPNLRIETNKDGDQEYVYTAYRQKKETPQTVKIYGGKLLENISQALAGEILKTAIHRVEEKKLVLQESAVYPLVNAQNHDELLAAVIASKAKLAKHIVKEAMTQPLEWWKEIRLNAEVGVGLNWLEAKQ